VQAFYAALDTGRLWQSCLLEEPTSCHTGQQPQCCCWRMCKLPVTSPTPSSLRAADTQTDMLTCAFLAAACIPNWPRTVITGEPKCPYDLIETWTDWSPLAPACCRIVASLGHVTQHHLLALAAETLVAQAGGGSPKCPQLPSRSGATGRMSPQPLRRRISLLLGATVTPGWRPGRQRSNVSG
jgi:hypothetical protein